MAKPLPISANMTGTDPNHQASYQGMAHFAGTGPQGSTCRECQNWGHGKKFKRDRWGELADRQCVKYIRLMHVAGPGVPHDAAACKYFLQRPDVKEARKERTADDN